MVTQDAAFKMLLSTGQSSMQPHLLEQRARKAVAIFLRGVRKGV
jgi:hypothetical protein